MLKSILNYFTKSYAEQLKELAADAANREKERQYKSLLKDLKSSAKYGSLKREVWLGSLPEDTASRLKALGFNVKESFPYKTTLIISWD